MLVSELSNSHDSIRVYTIKAILNFSIEMEILNCTFQSLFRLFECVNFIDIKECVNELLSYICIMKSK